jgi:hypothetical protein
VIGTTNQEHTPTKGDWSIASPNSNALQQQAIHLIDTSNTKKQELAPLPGNFDDLYGLQEKRKNGRNSVTLITIG